jgi:hypothetical protein
VVGQSTDPKEKVNYFKIDNIRLKNCVILTDAAGKEEVVSEGKISHTFPKGRKPVSLFLLMVVFPLPRVNPSERESDECSRRRGLCSLK